MLTLVKDVTYKELQKLIYQAVDVPADKQKIRVGFPPKLLEPPADGKQEEIVHLNHGDKIALEVLPNFDAAHEGMDCTHVIIYTCTLNILNTDTERSICTVESFFQVFRILYFYQPDVFHSIF